jgi:hypothetical protein
MIGTQVVTENTQKQSNVKSQEVKSEQLKLEQEDNSGIKKELAMAKDELNQLVDEVHAIEDKDVKNSDDYQMIVKKYKLIEDQEAKIAELEESLR